MSIPLLTQQGRCFINRFQGGFPLAERPFAIAAAQLDSSEDALLAVTAELLQRGLLSRLGPIVDATRLGGGLTLAALAVPERRFDEVAVQIGALPQVAHNYRRDHPLNMWFVVATETPAEITETLATIQRRTGLEVLNFPKQREFYLGLWLDLREDGRIDTIPAPNYQQPLPIAPTPLDDLDRRILVAVQAGIAPLPDPWSPVASEAGCDTDELLRRLQRMLAGGIVRRVGAVPNHYRLGLRGNGMSVWDVPTEQVPELGTRIGALGFVSHCYQRPRRRPRWPYNLFAMVHGIDRDEVRNKVERIAALLGPACRAHDVLFSSAVLKKTGLRLAQSPAAGK